MKKYLIKWVILGIVFGGSVGFIGYYKLFKDETRTVDGKGPIELKVKEFKNLDTKGVVKEKEVLIKEIDIDGKLYYDDIKMDKDEVYIRNFVFNKTENMELKDDKYLTIDGEIIGESLIIDGEIYGLLNRLEKRIEIKDGLLTDINTEKSEKVQFYDIESKVLDSGQLRKVKKEKVKLEEILKTKKENEDRSDLHYYEDEYEYKIDIEEIKKKVSKKENFYKENRIEIFNSEGRYYFLELFSGSMEITYALVDRKEEKIYTKKVKEANISIKGGFFYEDDIYLLERKGDILKVKGNGKKIKVLEEYKNDKRNESAIEFNLIGMEGDNVYFRNILPVDSLMSFNVKEKKFDIVYDSKYETMENMDMKNGYITLYKGSEKSEEKIIGLLKDGKIEAKIEGIGEVKNSVTEIFNDKAVIIGTKLENKLEKTKIKILKL